MEIMLGYYGIMEIIYNAFWQSEQWTDRQTGEFRQLDLTIYIKWIISQLGGWILVLIEMISLVTFKEQSYINYKLCFWTIK